MITSVFLLCQLAIFVLAQGWPTIIDGVCPKKNPQIARVGDSCGIPPFVDVNEFGDNKDTTGRMMVRARRNGLTLNIILSNLPRPDLVLTAWIIWVPFGVTEPSVFKIANHASPCAPFTARFSGGFGYDPNRLRNIGNKAILSTHLNFNPTHEGEGPLTRETFSFQKDVPGIQETTFRQYRSSGPNGVFIPTSSDYLRKYNESTGFEVLGGDGKPIIARSPVKAMGIEIVAHVDKTTHGISQGIGGVDHYFVLFFPFESKVGKRTVM